MPFDGKLYEKILNDYETRRMIRTRERNRRLEEVYNQSETIRALDVQINQVGSAAMLEILKSPAQTKQISSAMQAKLDTLYAERKNALKALGYSETYTDLVFDCKKCKDSGYVNGQICDCLKQRAAAAVKQSSEISPMLETQNFENFELDLFSKETIPDFDISAYELMQENLQLAKQFVRDFGKKTESLLFYGGAGCGKTFLSSCIANALIEKNVNVVYKSAVRLFGEYLDYMFNRTDAQTAKQMLDQVQNAQLLIIDDLGTEAVNQHTVSYLFQLVNERIIKKQSTIISTNLTLKEISTAYSERISSRIFEQYVMVEFIGEDLRLKNGLPQV